MLRGSQGESTSLNFEGRGAGCGDELHSMACFLEESYKVTRDKEMIIGVWY